MATLPTPQQISAVEELEIFIDNNFISSYNELTTIIRHRAFGNISKTQWDNYRQTLLAFSDHFNHIFESMQNHKTTTND